MDGPRDVFFVLLPSVVLLDVAGPADAFRNAEAQRPGSYRLRFVAPQPEIQAAVGLNLSGLEALPRQLRPGSIVVLTGVTGARIDMEHPATQAVLQWLRSPAMPPALLMCVCAGSVLAGHAGLLAGRACTTHHEHLDELRRVVPSARVLDNRIFVEDGTVFTSAGVTAGLDLALHVIGCQQGARPGGVPAARRQRPGTLTLGDASQSPAPGGAPRTGCRRAQPRGALGCPGTGGRRLHQCAQSGAPVRRARALLAAGLRAADPLRARTPAGHPEPA
jgi:putative intracellular protease/amidase